MDKNKAIIILAVLTLVFLIFNIASCMNAYNKDSLRKKEMFQRMELEEKMAKTAQENLNASVKLRDMQKKLDDEKADHEATKKLLIQEQLIEKSLKEDLQKLTRLNEALDEELKKVSTTSKRAKIMK